MKSVFALRLFAGSALVAFILGSAPGNAATAPTPANGSAAAAPAPYHVIATWPVGGEGGWDALTADTSARRLYVSHATRVEVLDLDSGKSVGVILDTPGVHAIAIASALGRGFVSAGRDSSVIIFDTKTLARLARVHLPAANPDAILFEPVSSRVFAFNGGNANLTALDAASGAVVGTLDLGGRPEFAVADGKGGVDVNIEDRGEVVTLDARSLAITHRWPLAPGEEPTGIALDRERHRLFSTCSNGKLVVLDSESGKLLDTLRIGERVDGAAFDARRRLVFTSNGIGTLTVGREAAPGRFEVAENDSTRLGARTIAIDERTGRVFVVTASFGPPPAPTAERPHPRPSIVPDTFVVLVLGRSDEPVGH